MKKITIETLPHAHQAYDTVGDYWEDENGIHIVVSDMGDEKMEQLVGLHELVEVILMRARGIPLAASTVFDKEFDQERADTIRAVSQAGMGKAMCFLFRNRELPIEAEPGDDPDSPYQNEHNFATAVERMVCAALGIKWDDYDRRVQAVGE